MTHEFHTIKHESIRPMLTLRTPMNDIPPEFARLVMPNLAYHGFQPCWIWMGPVAPTGLPIRRPGGRMLSMRRIVARMFWDYPEQGVIRMTCPNINCLNPEHMLLCHPLFVKSEKTNGKV